MNHMQPGIDARYPRGIAVESANGSAANYPDNVKRPNSEGAVLGEINALSEELDCLLKEMAGLADALRPAMVDRPVDVPPMGQRPAKLNEGQSPLALRLEAMRHQATEARTRVHVMRSQLDL